MAVENVLVLTGTRAEYGLLKPAMTAIRDHDDLSLSVVATGMHLSPRYGRTVTDITDDGFDVDREVLMQMDGDTGTAMAKSLGIGTAGLAEAFESLDLDLVLLLGDRDESLAGALAASHMNIPVAHVHGGDAMNGAVIDDSNRYALTKFAHLHFPASTASATRIEKLGEEPWRITTVGAPGLDDILREEYDDSETVCDRYDLDLTEPLFLVVQHPLTTRHDEAGEQMSATLDAVDRMDGQTVIIYPNADAGGQQIIGVIESRSFDDPVRKFKSLPRREYLGVMAAADVMVGNSSSGIIEAPSFALPVVDVGSRQSGRERASNVVAVPHETDRIHDGIERCLNDDAFRAQVENCDSPYDFGGAGKQICTRLANLACSRTELLQKQITY